MSEIMSISFRDFDSWAVKLSRSILGIRKYEFPDQLVLGATLARNIEIAIFKSKFFKIVNQIIIFKIIFNKTIVSSANFDQNVTKPSNYN